MNAEMLTEMARHQAWADAAHWKTIHENAALRDDGEIQTRLNHMVSAMSMLMALSRGETPDLSHLKDVVAPEQLESAMQKAHAELEAMLASADLEKKIQLHGPNGPFEAPVGVLLLQAVTHSQHHRAQNAARMRQLGVKPPMTDLIIWYALGRP